MVKLASHYLRLDAEHQSAWSCVSALHCVNLAFSRLLAQCVGLNAQLLCFLFCCHHSRHCASDIEGNLLGYVVQLLLG